MAWWKGTCRVHNPRAVSLISHPNVGDRCNETHLVPHRCYRISWRHREIHVWKGKQQVAWCVWKERVIGSGSGMKPNQKSPCRCRFPSCWGGSQARAGFLGWKDGISPRPGVPFSPPHWPPSSEGDIPKSLCDTGVLHHISPGLLPTFAIFNQHCKPPRYLAEREAAHSAHFISPQV